MTDVHPQRSCYKACLGPIRQRTTGQRPTDAGGIDSTLLFDGRDAWALDQLIKAGKLGCTPIDNPAPRWSHYVWKLRRAGLSIETHDEAHGGPYAGHHARYELRSRLVVLETSFSDGAA